MGHALCGVVWGTGSSPQQAKWSCIYFALLEAGCAHLGEGAAPTAPSLHLCLQLGSHRETRCQVMELQHPLQPRLGTLSLIGLSNICTVGHLEACREGGFPKQDSQNKCAKQGPLKGGQQEMCETALGPGSCPSSRSKTLTNGEVSLHSGFAALTSLLPLKLDAETFLPKSRQEKVPCLSERKGCLSSPFPIKRKPLSEEIESPTPRRTPCQPGCRLFQWRESQCSQTPILHGEIKHPLI